MPDLTPWIVAHHRSTTGKTFKAEYADHVSAFKADAALLAHAKAEHARLIGLDAALAGKLQQRDHDQYVQMVSIQRMLANHEDHLTNERKQQQRARPGKRTARKTA